jgi:hypothetical protein
MCEIGKAEEKRRGRKQKMGQQQSRGASLRGLLDEVRASDDDAQLVIAPDGRTFIQTSMPMRESVTPGALPTVIKVPGGGESPPPAPPPPLPLGSDMLEAAIDAPSTEVRSKVILNVFLADSFVSFVWFVSCSVFYYWCMPVVANIVVACCAAGSSLALLCILACVWDSGNVAAVLWVAWVLLVALCIGCLTSLAHNVAPIALTVVSWAQSVAVIVYVMLDAPRAPRPTVAAFVMALAGTLGWGACIAVFYEMRDWLGGVFVFLAAVLTCTAYKTTELERIDERNFSVSWSDTVAAVTMFFVDPIVSCYACFWTRKK